MKLIDNWKTVARKAHSMWAFYLSFIALVLPEAIYLFTRIDTNPRLWWFIGLALLAYGIVFRLKDQSISAVKALAVLALLLGASAPPEPAWAMGDPEKTPTVQIPADPVADAEAAALAIAVPFIAGWEGKRNAAYRDVVGVWTICYGSTRGVKPGMVMTDAECTALLRREVAEYRHGVHRYLATGTIRDFLPPYRDAAFTSFAFNVGIAGAGKSTAARRLNAGNIAGACEALTWWNKAGGRVIRGLVRRRSAERDLCLGRAA